jgi:hypothetical protein
VSDVLVKSKGPVACNRLYYHVLPSLGSYIDCSPILQDAWYSVLECISRLEELANNPAAQSQLLPGGNQPSRDALIHGIQELAGMPTEGVFVNSNRLPSDAIVEFFTALCKVSRKILLLQE